MAVNEIKVNTVALKNDADDVAGCIKAMESELEKMATSIAQLSSMWEGPTKMVFDKQFEADREAASDIIKELKLLNDYEEMAKNRYNQCEKKIEEIIASIKV
jgi:WXG100 family type VII secretion target